VQHVTRILCISGSLRRASLNSAVLEALREVASDDFCVCLYQRVAELPLFNPDNEQQLIPALHELKQAISQADVLLIASPEYAHGITGALKNLLDHLVSGEEIVCKPVVLINTSPRASHAQQSLREILQTMSAKILDGACLDIPLLGRGLPVDQIVHDPMTRQQLLGLLEVLKSERLSGSD